ncbi:MAG: hypothetical protein JSU70_18840 [Phycisphaerales bacterium]|nr:MAG: hypothetical protein JSU70_18840 [Phycisphaerales bacterium]
MVDQEVCHGCEQSNQCRQIYEKLGKSEGPSVTRTVCIALLLPLVVFVGCLAACDRVLTGVIKTEELQTAVSLAVALAVACGLTFSAKAIDRQLGKRRQSRNSWE